LDQTSGKNVMTAKHNLILEGRRTLNVSGVKDVTEFDEGKVMLLTEAGELYVEGEKLHINNFSQQTGELDLDGRINSLIYNEHQEKEGGFFSRLFR